MALKKLEENTKSLDFGQGHTGRKRHHNNLSLLLDFVITFGSIGQGERPVDFDGFWLVGWEGFRLL